MADPARRRTRKIFGLVGGGAALAGMLAVTGISAAGTRAGGDDARSRPSASTPADKATADKAPADKAAADKAAADKAAKAEGLRAEIELPDGFQPEGIAIGDEPVAFFGSLADGAIFRADLTTGEGEVIGEAPGTPSVGMKLDGDGRLFVAGGRAGDARVVDSRTGAVIEEFDLATEEESFVNDVVLTPDGAFFTDSTNPVLYHLPIGADGELPAKAEQIELTGDIEYADGINANGIALAPDGETLLLVQTNKGLLFGVDPETGVATRTSIVAADDDNLLANGDGLLVDGNTLFAVQNQLNKVAVLEINDTGSQADVVDRLIDLRFDVPTTVAESGGLLFLPNARFGTEVTPDTGFNAVAVPKP